MSANLGPSAIQNNGTTVSLSGVVSGSVLVVFSPYSSTSPTDTFATPYTWTQFGSGYGVFIGTGGEGTSGDVTASTSSSGSFIVVAVSNTAPGSGLAVLDPGSDETSSDTASVTPTLSGDLALFFMVGQYGLDNVVISVPTTVLGTGNDILGYPAWVASVSETSPLPDVAITMSANGFGGAVSISALLIAGLPPPTSPIVMIV